MAWWQIGALAGLILALAYVAALLHARRRTVLFLIVALLAAAVTWITVGLMLGAIAPGRTGLMLPASSRLVPAQNEALRQERLLHDELRRRHPEAIPRIAEIERLHATDAAAAGLRRAQLALLAAYLPVYAPRSSDDSIRRFAAVTVETLQALQARDAMACREIAAGRHAAVPDAFQPRAIEALTEVLASAMRTPQPPPDAAEAIALRRQAIDQVYAGGDARLVERSLLARSADAPPDAYCHTFIQVFRTLLALPPEQGGKVLRLHYGQENGNG